MAMPPRRKAGRAILMVGVCFVRKLVVGTSSLSWGDSSWGSLFLFPKKWRAVRVGEVHVLCLGCWWRASDVFDGDVNASEPVNTVITRTAAAVTALLFRGTIVLSLDYQFQVRRNESCK